MPSVLVKYFWATPDCSNVVMSPWFLSLLTVKDGTPRLPRRVWRDATTSWSSTTTTQNVQLRLRFVPNQNLVRRSQLECTGEGQEKITVANWRCSQPSPQDHRRKIRKVMHIPPQLHEQVDTEPSLLPGTLMHDVQSVKPVNTRTFDLAFA